MMNVSFGSKVDSMGILTQQLASVRTDFALGLDSDAKHNDCYEDYLRYSICRHHSPMNFYRNIE